MKTARIARVSRLAMVCFGAGSLVTPGLAQPSVLIDFDGVAPFTDFPTYSEEGFTLTPNVGEVRINNAFAPFSNAAQPSFGFGQGFDSSFAFTSDLHLPFRLESIDLLEATGFPDKFGVTLIGTRSDSSVVTQTFTLDGIAGAQSLTLPLAFSDLTSVKIAEDAANGFVVDVVQIDDVRFTVLPEPSTWSLLGAAGGVILLWLLRGKRQNRAA